MFEALEDPTRRVWIFTILTEATGNQLSHSDDSTTSATQYHSSNLLDEECDSAEVEKHRLGQGYETVGRSKVRTAIQRLLHIDVSSKPVALLNSKIREFLPSVRTIIGGEDASDLPELHTASKPSAFLAFFVHEHPLWLFGEHGSTCHNGKGSAEELK